MRTILRKIEFTTKENGPVDLDWYIRWRIARWHWRKWLRYEGMPKYLKTLEEMLDWETKAVLRRTGRARQSNVTFSDS